MDTAPGCMPEDGYIHHLKQVSETVTKISVTFTTSVTMYRCTHEKSNPKSATAKLTLTCSLRAPRRRTQVAAPYMYQILGALYTLDICTLDGMLHRG